MTSKNDNAYEKLASAIARAGTQLHRTRKGLRVFDQMNGKQPDPR